MRLFVYGTLAPGNDAWPVLEPWVIGRAARPTPSPAVLYDTGRGYPAATFARRPTPDVARARDRRDARSRAGAGRRSDALDRYEGDEYERIDGADRGAALDVATYAWIAPLAGCRPVAGGRWGDSGA